MNAIARTLLSPLLIFTLAFSPPAAFSQDNAPPSPNLAPKPALTQQELDQVLAPIALYPDGLLSQIMMASTYPLEVVQAARWSKANPGLKGDQAVRAAELQDWDPSVKSLVAFPEVIAMLDQKLDWLERLGNAVLTQQEQVTETIQKLRQRAQTAGNLRSNEQVRVEQQGPAIVIAPAQPEVVYVPYYDPLVVYGSWWWPAYPPYYWAPPRHYVQPVYASGFFWGAAVVITAGFFFGAFDWRRQQVSVVNVTPYYVRPRPNRPAYIAPGVWRHDPEHRRGAVYRDEALRQQYSRPAAPGARPPGEFRGSGATRGTPPAPGEFRGSGVAPGATRPSPPAPGEARGTRVAPPATRASPPVPPEVRGPAVAPPATRASPPVPGEARSPAVVPPATRVSPPVPPEVRGPAVAPPVTRVTPPVPPEVRGPAVAPPVTRASPPAPPAPAARSAPPERSQAQGDKGDGKGEQKHGGQKE